MTSPKQPADLVDAYARWVSASIDAWATSATALADRAASGSYDAAAWMAEAGAYAGRMTKATVDLYQSLVAGAGSPTVRSDEYPEPAPKSVTGPVDLRIAGPLHAQYSQTTVAAGAATIVRTTATTGEKSFHVELDRTNLPGDAYWAKVEVVANGAVVETVDVVVQVP
jgi:hypothetical protein